MKTRTGDYAKRIPRARAVAALDLANAILDLEDDLLQLEQPGDPNEGMEDGTTTVERDVWLEWVATAMEPALRTFFEGLDAWDCEECGSVVLTAEDVTELLAEELQEEGQP